MSDAPSNPDVFSQQYTLSGDFGDASREVQSTVMEAVEARAFDPSSVFSIRLALQEALSNAFKHGNQGDPAKVVRLACCVSDDRVVIDIEDEGPGFDPGSVPDPTEEENLEIPAGRGIMIMKAYMSDVTFEPPGNKVRLTFRRPDADASN